MWRLQKICNKGTQENKYEYNENREPDIDKEGSGLHLVFLVGIFRNTQEFDHGVAQQSLLYHFRHGHDHQEERPDTIILSGDVPDQYEISNYSKEDDGEPMEQSIE